MVPGVERPDEARGPHLPAVGAQSKLVTEFSVPNILGFVLGLGGETPGVRTAMEALLFF